MYLLTMFLLSFLSSSLLINLDFFTAVSQGVEYSTWDFLILVYSFLSYKYKYKSFSFILIAPAPECVNFLKVAVCLGCVVVRSWLLHPKYFLNLSYIYCSNPSYHYLFNLNRGWRFSLWV